MGLLPVAPCGPDELDSECPWLWQTAEALRDAALVGLAPYIPPVDSGCEDDFATYISMGQPVAEMRDGLSVNLVNVTMEPDSARQKARFSGCGDRFHPALQATWNIELWENGYPVVEKAGGGWVVPAPDLLTAVNQHVYTHGIAMYAALHAAQADNTLDLPANTSRVTVGQMVPLPPLGAAVGWRIGVVTVHG